MHAYLSLLFFFSGLESPFPTRRSTHAATLLVTGKKVLVHFNALVLMHYGGRIKKVCNYGEVFCQGIGHLVFSQLTRSV